MAEAQDNTEIYEYLANEVLARFPEDLQEFLVKTAVLAVVTPEESDLLLRRRDSAEILSRLEKESLFLTRLAGAKRSYRYHSFFGSFSWNAWARSGGRCSWPPVTWPGSAVTWPWRWSTSRTPAPTRN